MLFFQFLLLIPLLRGITSYNFSHFVGFQYASKNSRPCARLKISQLSPSLIITPSFKCLNQYPNKSLTSTCLHSLNRQERNSNPVPTPVIRSSKKVNHYSHSTNLSLPLTPSTTTTTSSFENDSSLQQTTKVGKRNENNASLPSSTTNPRHVAFICDGNSRWARVHNSQIIKGHAKGASRVLSTIRHLQEHQPSVRYVTIYGFSTENWSRSVGERNGLWKVFEHTSRTFYDLALDGGVRVKLLGDLDDERIPQALRNSLRKLEKDSWSALEDSGEGEPLTLCLAINYGGRKDIVNASCKMADLLLKGELSSDEIINDESILDGLLSTSGFPDPDIVIRTGGEQRLSNFLIWNCAYAELYFTDVLWPDFNSQQLDNAIDWYRCRHRRFGGRDVTATTNDKMRQ